ncbi:MAG: hypothetical protein KKA62_00930 [Nanoarchaeota archaeon]|nr:hypothetical protein [Nanoarchaeota archaeon]MBU1644494.1 hypothetical protein [Nanoarchaeota archaeon]MBU1976498.1 hypothetical protein [Nanoarchaeota archaeon]
MYYFTNLIGTFILDNKLKVIDSLSFKNVEEYSQRENKEKQLIKKHQAGSLPENKLPQVLSLFKNQKYYSEFFLKNLQLTKQSIKESVNEDNLIIQTIANINELDRISNTLVKRLREWYSLYFPELAESVQSHEKFVELVSTKTRSQLLKDLHLEVAMGADLADEHLEEMHLLAKEVSSLYELRNKHEDYLKKIMEKYCPNLNELAGTTIGAKLIELGGSLKHLAMLPASTIQLLGAEKALFRHIKTGSKSPKYGVIINHPLIQDAKKDEKGKASRMLADKLSLCARLDFFKGEFKAKEYRKELEEKLR